MAIINTINSGIPDFKTLPALWLHGVQRTRSDIDLVEVANADNYAFLNFNQSTGKLYMELWPDIGRYSGDIGIVPITTFKLNLYNSDTQVLEHIITLQAWHRYVIGTLLYSNTTYISIGELLHDDNSSNIYKDNTVYLIQGYRAYTPNNTLNGDFSVTHIEIAY